MSAENVFNQAAPPLCMGMFSCFDFQWEGLWKSIQLCSLFSTLLPSNYGGKEENMFTMLSYSFSFSLPLHKLTAHHKSISAWRKSISRLPLLSYKKKNVLLFKKKTKKKLQSSGGEGGRAGGGGGGERKGRRSRSREREMEEKRGGGSKRIIHPLFGEQVCLNETWRAAVTTYRLFYSVWSVSLQDTHTSTYT